MNWTTEPDGFAQTAPGGWILCKRTWLKPGEWRYVLWHAAERIGDYATGAEAKAIAAPMEREYEQQRQASGDSGDETVVQGNG